MFRTSVVHLQERSYAVCCNLVCLDTSCCYEGEGRTGCHQFFLLNVMNKINHQILCILLDYIYIHIRSLFKMRDFASFMPIFIFIDKLHYK